MIITIREIDAKELEIIQWLAHEIWPLVYVNMISRDQIDYMLKWMYSKEKLIEDYRKGVQFVVMGHESDDFGFVAFELKQEETFLHKLYLHPNYHGKGLGKDLLSHVVKACLDNNSSTLRLTVNRNNPNVAFYLSQGFFVEQEKDFDIGQGYWMNDYVMKKVIK
jgi:GNAT superfamily N-acetyltransferase